MKLRLGVLACAILFALMPLRAMAQSTAPVILPSGCGTGAFVTSFGYLTVDSTGKLCDGGGGTIAVPYQYTPLSPMQAGLTVATATALTIPTGSTYAVICASGANVNYTTDGTTTPTATVGMPLISNQCVSLSGTTVLANFKAIQQSATATLNVSYFK